MNFIRQEFREYFLITFQAFVPFHAVLAFMKALDGILLPFFRGLSYQFSLGLKFLSSILSR